ncbi:DNA-directed RNA polymerase III subunit RPC5 [Plasmodiophora brassicae]|nr:hypothetical protein PBRA_004455 [Plasmodiophora brassicae]
MSYADDDHVVCEMPVYYSGVDAGSSTVNVLTYPLRPHDRPYDGHELGSVAQMRVKPVHGCVQLEFERRPAAADDDMADENGSAPFTLSSVPVHAKANYAIGIVSQGQLRLVPVSQLYSMLPDFRALDDASIAAKAEKHPESSSAKAATEAAPKTILLRAQNKSSGAGGDGGEPKKTYHMFRQEREAEKWVPLKVHQHDSDEARSRLHALASQDIPDRVMMEAELPVDKYLAGVCSSQQQAAAAAGSDDVPATLQADIVRILRNASVIPFRTLCNLLSVRSEPARAAAIAVLSNRAVLVQNCWVAQSSLSYTGRAALARDFLLQLFSRSNRVLLSSFTSVAQLDLAASRAMIGSLADFDPDSKEWVFKCPFDDAFGRQYPGIVAQQSAVLARVDYEAQLLGKSARAGPALAPVPAEDIYSGSSSDEDDTMIGRNAIPHRAAAPAGVNVESARPSKQERPAVEPPSAMDVDPSEALVNAALDHLSDVGVCSAPTLSSVLSQSSDPSLRKTTLDEIERVLNRVAKPFVKGTFCRVSVPDKDDSADERFRNAVIDMFVSAPGKLFRKADIKAAVLERTGHDLPDRLYVRLVKELAVSSTKSSWAAKTAS